MTQQIKTSRGRMRRRNVGLIVGLLASVASFSTAAEAGSFAGPFPWNFIPIHSALLPDGKIMTFGATPQDGQGGFDYDLWDPTLGNGAEAHQQLPNILNFDSFCVGSILSPFNSRLLLAGGNANERVAEFDYKKKTAGLSATFSFKYPRYYASLATLPDGRLLVHGGAPSYGNQTNASAISEIFEPGKGWRELPGTADSPMRIGDQAATGNPFWYPHLYPIGGDEVFIIAGKYTYKLNYSGNGSVSEVKPFTGTNYGATSSGLMFRPGLVMQVGGGSHGNNTGDGHMGSNVATIFDLRNKANITSRDTQMAFKRHFPTASVLPNGEVLVLGGAEGNNELYNVANTAEIYNPDTDRWRQDATMQIPRLYHSSSILMKDGRVFIGGGGAPGPVVGRSAEIYTPDYLLDAKGVPAVRPSITAGPVRIALGQTFRVAADQPISRMTLVKTGAVTHGYNTDQRFFEVGFQAANNGYDVTFPNDALNATPGLYMLFAFDAKGVPSVGKYIRLPSPIGDDGNDIPNDVPTSPAPTGTGTGTPVADNGGNGGTGTGTGTGGTGTGTGGTDLAGTLPQTQGGPILAAHSKLCLSVAGDAATEGAGIVQDTCRNAAAQNWQLVAQGGGYLVKNASSNKCLDVYDNGMNDGSKVVQWTCTGAANQIWKAQTTAAGVSLVASHSSKCLDVAGISTAPGAQVWQWTCLNQPNQAWNGVATTTTGTTPTGTGGALPTAQAGPILAAHSKLCLSVAGDAAADGAGIVQDTCRSTAAQNWQLVAQGGGYLVKNASSNKCLDVYGAGMGDGTKVVQWTCHGGANQVWKTQKTAAGVSLVASHSNKCLDVSGVSTAAGAQVWQWTCLNAANQAWNGVATTTGTTPTGTGGALPTAQAGPILAAHSKLCLSVAGNGTDNGAGIVQDTCRNAAAQNWQLVAQGGGYLVKNASSNKCLDVYQGGMDDGSKVVQWDCLGNANQIWKAQKTAAGTALVVQSSNKCLDVAGVSTAPGAQVWQWTCLNSANQAWNGASAPATN